MSNKLRLQITEKYRRNVFINVVVPEGRLYEFDCILDKYENSYNDYQTLIEELSDEGFKVLFVDDNKNICRVVTCSECVRLSLMNLLEEYKEPVKLTKFEYEYLKVAKRERFNFIARDGDGRSFLYKNKPLKSSDEWIVASKDCCRILDSLFKFVKWEDEDPYNINEILSNCEVIKNDV
ncbi:MAG: hypothetical protein ACLU9Y_04185 [Thomasclavelia ramosa]